MKNPFLLSLFSGVLLVISWPFTGALTPLIFIALVPLLVWNEKATQEASPSKHFLVAWIAFLVWNIGTTYWLGLVQGAFVSRLVSAAGPIILNSLIMAVVWQLFHFASRYMKKSTAYVALLFFWLGYEYFHLNWELAWPWLELGNVFANRITWIQWYEFTGVHGGSLWVLLANMLMFEWYKKLKNKDFSFTRPLIFSGIKQLIVIVLPVIFSGIIYNSYQPKGENATVALVQPNIDPYTEKYHGISPQMQLKSMINLSVESDLSDVDLLVFPESSIHEPNRFFPSKTGKFILTGLWENNITNSQSYKTLLKEILNPFPVSVLSGVMTDSLVSENRTPSHTLVPLGNTNRHLETYNTAILFTSDTFQVYHKAKLVPGVENVPFARYFSFLEGLALDMGGAVGSLGTEKKPKTFWSKNKKIIAAPIICYESVFGEYVTEFVQQKANLIAVITNDAWWDDSAGHKQHFEYARLRAIECRKDVARCANTGISGFIDQKGNIVAKTQYLEKTALKRKVKLNPEITFYTQYGDFLGRNASFLAVLMFFYIVVKRAKERSRSV